MNSLAVLVLFCAIASDAFSHALAVGFIVIAIAQLAWAVRKAHKGAP